LSGLPGHQPNKTIPVFSRELFVLRKTGSDWRIADYMLNSPERAESEDLRYRTGRVRT
jgi:hypothetical protein